MADFYTELHEILDDRFDLEELRVLCVRLGMNYENLSQQNKQAFIRTLVDYLRRRKRIPALYEAIRVERPDVHEDLPTMPSVAPSRFAPAASAASAAPSSPVSVSAAARPPWTVVAGVAGLSVLVVALLVTRAFGAQGAAGSPTASITQPPDSATAPQLPAPTNDPSAPTTYRYGGGSWPSWQQTFTTNGANSRTSLSGDDFCIDVLNTGQDIWDIEVGPNPILLPSNRSYTLRVTARASSNRIARVHVKYAPRDDVSVSPNDTMVIGPEASTHTFDFSLRTDQSIQSVWMSVLVGGKDQGLGTVCLSSVVIEPR